MTLRETRVRVHDVGSGDAFGGCIDVVVSTELHLASTLLTAIRELHVLLVTPRGTAE